MRGGGRKTVMEMSHNRSFSNGLGERLHVDPVCQISDKDGISANTKNDPVSANISERSDALYPFRSDDCWTERNALAKMNRAVIKSICVSQRP